MTTLKLVLLTGGWALLGFVVIRTLLVVRGHPGRLASATAIAVAGAFALGALAPFSLWRRPTPDVPSAPAAAPVLRSVSCPANAKIGTKVGFGHLDAVAVANAPADVAARIDVPRGSTVGIDGWLAAENGPASGLCVLVDGHRVAFDGHYGANRPDVATALGKAADSATGFDVQLTLRPGVHTVTVAPIGNDNSIELIGQVLRVNAH